MVFCALTPISAIRPWRQLLFFAQNIQHLYIACFDMPTLDSV